MNIKLPQILAESVPYANEYDPNDMWFFPLRTSDYAEEVDVTFYVEYGICALFMFVIYFFTVYYCIKYRRKENDPVPGS